MDLADVREVLERQVRYNMAIAEEGLCGNYGANIGKVLLATYGDQDVKVRAKAMAAAGSDARMNGCELPVVINSGSGKLLSRSWFLQKNCRYRKRRCTGLW